MQISLALWCHSHWLTFWNGFLRGRGVGDMAATLVRQVSSPAKIFQMTSFLIYLPIKCSAGYHSPHISGYLPYCHKNMFCQYFANILSMFCQHLGTAWRRQYLWNMAHRVWTTGLNLPLHSFWLSTLFVKVVAGENFHAPRVWWLGETDTDCV